MPHSIRVSLRGGQAPGGGIAQTRLRGRESGWSKHNGVPASHLLRPQEEGQAPVLVGDGSQTTSMPSGSWTRAKQSQPPPGDAAEEDSTMAGVVRAVLV